MIFSKCPKIYQNLPSLFNLWTDKTIHVNLYKNCAIDLKKNNLYKRNFDVASQKFWLHFFCIGLIQFRKTKGNSQPLKNAKKTSKYFIIGIDWKRHNRKCKSNCTLDKESGFTHFGLSQKPLKAVSLRGREL